MIKLGHIPEQVGHPGSSYNLDPASSLPWCSAGLYLEAVVQGLSLEFRDFRRNVLMMSYIGESKASAGQTIMTHSK